MTSQAYTRAAALPQILTERIVVLDGAMGTMIQRHRLSEDDYRGERFKDHPKSLKGNNDLLQLTRPDVISAIHEQYLAAGADIVETNTFGATSVAQADYGLGAFAREINVEGAKLARAACDPIRAPESPASSPARSARRRRRRASAPTSTTRRRATSPSPSCAMPTASRPRASWKAAATCSWSRRSSTRSTRRRRSSPSTS